MPSPEGPVGKIPRSSVGLGVRPRPGGARLAARAPGGEPQGNKRAPNRYPAEAGFEGGFWTLIRQTSEVWPRPSGTRHAAHAPRTTSPENQRAPKGPTEARFRSGGDKAKRQGPPDLGLLFEK